MDRNIRRALLNTLAVLLGFVAWAAITSTGLVELPGPIEVARQAWVSLLSGQLESDGLASLARVLSGFVLGVAVAIPVGFLMGWYGVARGLIEPYVQFFRMIPPLAVIPLAIVTMGIGETPKVFVIFLAAFLSSVVAVYGGVISVDRTLINAARVLGAGDGTIFRRVIIPCVASVHHGGPADRLRLVLGNRGRRGADRGAVRPWLPHAAGAAVLRSATDLRQPDHDRRAGPADGPRHPVCREAPHVLAGTGVIAPKISFQAVSRTFAVGKTDRFLALDRLTLDIADGEFVTVVGPSGCGKSTAMNIAAGLEQPSAGRILVDGASVDGPGPERGIIFQQYALFPWLTVRENVEFGLRIAGKNRADRRAISDHFMALVGLQDFADALPKTLSGGMKQRCAIARAYAVNPKILLMDEPFGALDALTRVQLQDKLLEAWSRERRTVMFITHDVDEAVYLASRVVVMAARPGRLHRIIPVGLPYPRTEDIRLSPEFTAIRNEVWRSVYHPALAVEEPKPC